MLKKESVEEKNIINYNFHRIEVSLDENYNVYSITIHNENLNNKIGDYPIITVEEAKKSTFGTTVLDECYIPTKSG